MTDPLRRALVRAPRTQDLANWSQFGWVSEPDAAVAAREHEGFCDLLRESNIEVHLALQPVDGDPDAIYVCDPAILSNDGIILLRPGKPGRRQEPSALGKDLKDLGIAVASEMRAPATAEGGDAIWLDESTLLVGRGLRTNAAGIAELQGAFPDVNVIAFDLPYAKGPKSCFHLMSLLSPLDRDLAVAYVPLMPVRLMEMLAERSIRVIPVPDEEFQTMGPNVLAVAPRAAIAVQGNPETRKRMEAAGVDVRVYRGDHISHRGEGGPTCLTRPLLRSAA
ncbi:MAG: arginine deiminase family protein [Actinomycetota bacterium]|nr:arginine deiminase family protein [Actinomycetota bacterium]